MFAWVDRLAGRWMDWRTKRTIETDPNLSHFKIENLEMTDDAVVAVVSTPIAAILADHLAAMLDKANARNYVTFDMMPRPDRGLHPVRVTVKWAQGLSPAEKASLLEALLWDAFGVLREWPMDHPARSAAMDLCKRIDAQVGQQ